MPIAGLRPSSSLDTPTGRRPGSWRTNLLRIFPYGSQNAILAALTAVMKSEVTNDPVFHWFSKKTQAYRFLIGADLSGGDATGTAQTLTIDASTSTFGLKAGDILMVEQTGELLFVASTPTVATQVAVLRGFENANSTAVVAAGAGINPYLKKIGSAYEEGSAAPDPIGWDPDEQNNQTQIFREAYALTGTAMQVETRVGDTVKDSKMDCLEAFTMGLENAFIFGKKRTTSRNNQPLRMTDGIINQLPSANKISLAAYDGQLTLKYWESLIASVFRWGSSEKMAFCGVTAMLAVTQMVRLNTQLNWTIGAPSKEYGMDVQRLVTPMGTLVLKIHPMFGQMMGGTNGGTFYAGMDNAMLILDMKYLIYRYMKGRDVTYQPNMQLPGVDGLLAGYLAECGLELQFPETHMLLTGIRGGAKDD